MATHDVPGANPANADKLSAGSWAEHEDGSLIYVKGTEAAQVVYEIYDVAQSPPVYYQDAMRQGAFETQFSWTPGDGDKKDKWLWHDKTPFPWDRVIQTFDKPKPEHADVHDTLSAAARVAESLRLRAQRVKEQDLSGQEQTRSKTRPILDRFARALDAFME